MRRDQFALTLLVALGFGCGGEESPEILIEVSDHALLDGVEVVRVGFHSSTRSCADLRQDPLARAVVFRDLRLSNFPNGNVRVDAIPAGKYTVIAAGGPDGGTPTVFGCVPDQTIEDGVRLAIPIELRLLSQ
jgi:hypothetical protein